MKTNPWKRQGLFYVVSLQARMANGGVLTVTRSLDFITYHLIRWYHGEAELVNMAYRDMP